jgi:hypothetical protein
MPPGSPTCVNFAELRQGLDSNVSWLLCAVRTDTHSQNITLIRSLAPTSILVCQHRNNTGRTLKETKNHTDIARKICSTQEEE